MSDREFLLERLETVREYPYLPLYLTDEEFAVLSPELRHVATWGAHICIRKVDTDGFAYMAHRVGPRPNWQMADWGEDDQAAYEADLVAKGYARALDDVRRLCAAVAKKGAKGGVSIVERYLQERVEADETQVEALRRRCRSRRAEEARPSPERAAAQDIRS